MKLIVACLLFPLTVAQYGCTNCQTGYNTNSQYGTPNYVQSMGYNANGYSPSTTTSYTGSSVNSNQRFFNPSSNSPTSNYNQFTNTNLGYPYSGSSGLQRDQSSSLSGTYTGNNNIPLYDTTIGTRNAAGQTVTYQNAPFPASNYYASSTPSSNGYGYSSTMSPNTYGSSSTSSYGNNGYSSTYSPNSMYSSTYIPNSAYSSSTYSPSYSNSYNQNMGYTSGSNGGMKTNQQYYSPSSSSYSTGYNNNNDGYGRAYDSTGSSGTGSSSCCSTQSSSCCYQTGTSGNQGSTSIYYDPSLSANSYNRQYYGKK